MAILRQRITVRKKKKGLSDWQSAADAIVLTDSWNIQIFENLGKLKDIFRFSVSNANDRLFRTFFNGDNSTTAFTLKFFPIPATYLGTDKFQGYVGGVLQLNTTNYSVSGSTLTFVSAPASGTRNVEVQFNLVEVDDLIRIHTWNGVVWGSLTSGEKNLAIRMEGFVAEPSETIDDGGKTLQVRGKGLIDLLFNGLVFLTTDSNTRNRAHSYIQEVISQINSVNSAGGSTIRKIRGQDSGEWTALGNATPTKDVRYSSSYRTAIEIIEELSSGKFTDGTQFIYYVVYNSSNDSYDFIWKKKTLTVSKILTQGTVNAHSIKLSKDVDEVVNSVIFNVGPDPYGRTNMGFKFEAISEVGASSRWLYLTETYGISENVINDEFEANTSKWDTFTDAQGILRRTEGFPKDASYTYTITTFHSRNDLGVVTGNTITVDNDDQFADAIRKEAKARGSEVASQIIVLYNQPRLKSDWTFSNNQLTSSSTLPYALGEIHHLIVPSFGLHANLNKKARIFEIVHSFWGFTLSFEEDETTIPPS